MDSIHITDLKTQKAIANSRYRRIQKITTLFRFVELFILLITISRFYALFPFTYKLSGDYFRGLSLVLFSPRFVFVVGNTIVIILFLKSGNQSHNIDLCEEIIANREEFPKIHGEESGRLRKQSICEKEENIDNTENIYSSNRERKIYRSNSENLKREKARRELRRSMTESCRKSVNYSEKPAPMAEEEMSGEEFRRTVEAFIARQQRLLREEEFPDTVSAKL